MRPENEAARRAFEDIPGPVEVDFEKTSWIPERFSHARESGEMQHGVGLHRRDMLGKLGRADIQAVRQRGQAPSQFVRIRLQDTAHRATDKAGVSGDEECAHSESWMRGNRCGSGTLERAGL